MTLVLFLFASPASADCTPSTDLVGPHTRTSWVEGGLVYDLADKTLKTCDGANWMTVGAGGGGGGIVSMTRAQRDAIASPAAGMTIYQNQNKRLEWYDGLRWVTFSSVTISTNLSGASAGLAAPSCKNILDNDYSTGDGLYWIDPDGLGAGAPAFQAYCNMTIDGGGWTMVYANLFSGDEGGPTPVQMNSVYGTPGVNADHALNGMSLFPLVGASQMLVTDVAKWAVFSGMTSAKFNDFWTPTDTNRHSYSVLTSSGNSYNVSSGPHSTASGVHQVIVGSTQNVSTLFEYNKLTGARDTNHYWNIWPSANGRYAVMDGVTGNRWGGVFIR